MQPQVPGRYHFDNVAMHAAKMLMRTRRPRPWAWLLGVLCLAACSLTQPRFERPVLSVVGVEWVGGNLLRQDLRVKLNIQNPNDRTLPVKGLRVSMSVGGREIATGQSDRPFVVPARGDTDFDLSITANVALAVQQLAGRMNGPGNSIDYEMSGTASIDLPFFRDLPFRQSGSFSLK